MLTSNYTLRPSNIAATMSVLAVLSSMPAATEEEQHSNHYSATGYQWQFKSSFMSSTATDVSVSRYSGDEMTNFGEVVNEAYDALAYKQRRLDPRMATVLADSLWDLYVTD